MTTTAHETCHHVAYLLTCDQYEALLARSNGRCEICGIPAADTPRGKLSLDHDRALGFGAVRGLVCPKCNTHLGKVESAERPMDTQTARYLSQAWYLLHGIKPSGQTLIRQFRVEDELWDAARRRAKAEGTTLTAVINEALVAYAADELQKEVEGNG